MILQRVKISQKILFVITLALLVFVAFAIVTITMGNSQLRTLEEIYSKKVVPLDNLRKIQLLLREIEYRMAGVAADLVAPIGSGEHLKMSAVQIDTLWVDVKRRIHDEGLQKEIEEYEKGYSGFKEFIPLLQEAYFNEDVKKVVDLTDRFYEFKPVLYKAIDKMAATQEEAVKTYSIERTKTVSIINKAVIVLSIILVALFLFFGIIINRSISVPINNTVETIKDIAQGNGDLTKRLPVASKDEMGSLAEWFNVFIKGLHAMVKDIFEITGNVSVTAARIKQSSTQVHDSAKVQMQALETTSSSLWEMSSSVKTVASAMVELHKFTEDASSASTEMSTAVQEISNHAGELDNLADTTGASINQIAASIKQVATSIETLFQEAEEVSATIAEMGKTIQEIGAYAKEQAIMSEKVKAHASELGLQAVIKTVDGMTRIRQEVVSISEIIGSLGGMSKEIGKIVEVINAITDTTALLSLNASILAAQAGEHGKGFAVVAGEVRGLADRAALSTKEIDALVRQVQKQVVEAERSTKLGLDRVEEGVQLSTEAEGALKKIIESSTTSLEMARKIEGAIDEQASAVRLMMTSIQRVNSMVHEINKASKEQSRASDEILGATEKELGYTQLVRKSVSQQSDEITRLSKEITDASQRMQSISSAMAEQEKTIGHIVAAVQTIMNQSEMNVKYAEELDGIVGNLALQGGSLNKQVASFKV